MFSVAIYTLGCKLNQVESEALAAAFRQEGFTLLSRTEASPGETGAESSVPENSGPDLPAIAHNAGSRPDLIIINTCTVTSKADQKARRLIRKALRDASLLPGKNACVIVTGCYAQLESEVIAALDFHEAEDERRLFVVKGGEKSALLDLPRFISEHVSGGDKRGLRELVAAWDERREVTDTVFRFAPEDFSFHTRSFLKIQDGCGKHCTYCRIRLARGPSISLPASQALAELQTLEAAGYAEAVLTGVNISQYRDTTHGGLAELLEYLLAGTERIALRLSSLDPGCVDERFAPALANRRIRPHFHLSVQSGSAEILHKMGRGYSPQTIERAITLLRSFKDDPFLACDIITGFPGETQTEFEKTLALCEKTGFAWIHAFPYSKRPGTPAAAFRETVSERDAARRVETLIKLAHAGREDYVRRWQGREVELLVESGTAPKSGCCHGTSENYLKLRVLYAGKEAPPPGTVLRCTVGQACAPGGEFDAEAEEIQR
jgi:threonylcarbamoyladenosine tRNA methylthiotransferase MtaB